MTDKKEDVDFLLQRNADEQLADFDWERLGVAISSRLDEARQRRTSVVRFVTLAKAAAGIAAAAAVLLIAVAVTRERPGQMQPDSVGRAVVKLAESEGRASVEIQSLPDRPQVVVAVRARDADQTSGTASVEIAGLSDRQQVAVDIHTGYREPVLCRVEIIRPDESSKQDQSDGAWIVVAGYAPRSAENRVSRDMISIMCLF